MSSANALCCIYITCFDQDMAVSTVNNSEEQVKYKQEVKSLQSKRPWISFVPGFSLSGNSLTTDMIHQETCHVKEIKKVTFPFNRWCSVAIQQCLVVGMPWV